MATNLDYLVRVDLVRTPSSVQQANFVTALIAFAEDADSSSADNNKVQEFRTAQEVDSSTIFDSIQKAYIRGALAQDRVASVKAVCGGSSLVYEDIAENDNDWFIVVVDEGDVNLQFVQDCVAEGKGVAIGYTIADGATIAPVDPLYTDEVIAFADDDDGFDYAIREVAHVLGFDADLRSASWSWKELKGITPSEYGFQTRNDLLDENYNVYGVHQGTDIFANGVNVKGTPYKAIVSGLWFRARARESIADHLLYMNSVFGAVDYDNDGIGGIVSAIRRVLAKGEQIKHFVKDRSTVTAPTLQEVSQQDYDAEKLNIETYAVSLNAIREVAVRSIVTSNIQEVQ